MESSFWITESVRTDNAYLHQNGRSQRLNKLVRRMTLLPDKGVKRSSINLGSIGKKSKSCPMVKGCKRIHPRVQARDRDHWECRGLRVQLHKKLGFVWKILKRLKVEDYQSKPRTVPHLCPIILFYCAHSLYTKETLHNDLFSF